MEIAGIPRSTYYYQLKSMNSEDKDLEIKNQIIRIYNEHKGRYGYRRITQELRNGGISVNHKKVQRLAKALQLKSVVRVKKYTSYYGYTGKIAPNLLARNFKAAKPNEKWATDVTEFSLLKQKIYLSTIIDLFNGEVVCHNIHHHATFELVMDMLHKVLLLQPAPNGLQQPVLRDHG